MPSRSLNLAISFERKLVCQHYLMYGFTLRFCDLKSLPLSLFQSHLLCDAADVM
jgi:hypothetical protein